MLSSESNRAGLADGSPPAQTGAASTSLLSNNDRGKTFDDATSEVDGSSLSQDSPIEVVMAMSDLYKPDAARMRKPGGASLANEPGTGRCDYWQGVRLVSRDRPPLAATAAEADKGASDRGARPARAHVFDPVHPLLRLPRQSSDMADPWLMDGDGALDGPSGDPRALCLGEDPFLHPPQPRRVSASARTAARSVDGASYPRLAASPRASMDAAALHFAGKAYTSRMSFGDMSSQQPATLRLSEQESQSSLDLPTVNHVADGQQPLHNVGHLESVRELDALGGEQSCDGRSRARGTARYAMGLHRDPWRSVDSLLDTAAAEQRRRRRLQLFESGLASTSQLVRPSARLPPPSNGRRSCHFERVDPCTSSPGRVSGRMERSAVGDWIAGGSPYTRLSMGQGTSDSGCEASAAAAGRMRASVPSQRSGPGAAAPATSQSPFSLSPGTDDEVWGHAAERRVPVASSANVLSSRGSSRSAKEALLQRLARMRLSTPETSRHVVESASCPALGDAQQPAVQCDRNSGVRELRSSLLERIHHARDQKARDL